MRFLVAGILGVSMTTIGLLSPISVEVLGATPKPGTLLLAGAGLVCLGVFARKTLYRRRKR